MSAPRPAPLRAPPSLCTAGEAALFTCPIRGKLVSVCAGKAGAAYRFGRPGRIELTSRALTTASRGFSGGGETQITAAAGAYRYTVYNRTVRTSFGDDGRNDPADASGLIVRRGGRTLSAATCGTDATIASKAAALIAAGPYIDH